MPVIPRQAHILIAEAPLQRPRASAFFRGILAIPHIVVLMVMSVVAAVLIVIAWFAIAFTGRFPEGIYRVVTRYQRYSTAVAGYLALLTDRYPPFFGPGPGETYDVDLQVPEVQPSYHRGKSIFRIIVGIPVALLSYGMELVTNAGALLSWLSIVFTGRQSPRFREAVIAGLSYQARAGVYLALQTEDWPTLLDAVTEPPAAVPSPPDAAPPAGPPPPPPGY